ncbi:uncharacterized protein [Drosophila takahashii]|uniref:uncharacterized protein n=1 Tax=Drosophila takahashii TaxID=29030 RepID=UPI0038996D97
MVPRPRSAQALESRRTRGLNSYRCRVCRGIHPLRKCQRFLKLSAEKRLRAVLVNKYCSNCLAHEHSDVSCRSGDKCKTCSGKHHTLLHMHERPLPSATNQRSRRQNPPTRQALAPARRSASAASQQRSRRQNPPTRRALASPPRSASSTPAPSLASILQRHSVNVLPTAMVILETGLKKFDTAALIDPCTPTSCIDASLATAFRLPTTNVGDERICTATIRSKRDDDFKLEVVLKVEPNVRIRTPIRELADTVVSKYSDLPLADERFYLPATISVVLGADVYGKVIRPGFHLVDEGLPVAQRTTFGWILSGACNLS